MSSMAKGTAGRMASAGEDEEADSEGMAGWSQVGVKSTVNQKAGKR